MKKLVLLLLVCFFWEGLSGTAGLAAASGAVPQRGVVEGFYGKPWSQAERLELLHFMGGQGLNAYIYAPKDDSYHRAQWREPYPAEKLALLRQLVKAARAEQVEFIFALSPGLDINLRGDAAAFDLQILLAKLDSVYAVGVRQFAVFFDDIKNKDGRGQAELLNQIQKSFVQARPGVKPLITVPTEYFTEDMLKGEEVRIYTKAFARNLNPAVQVMYTGPTVVNEGIDLQDIKLVEKIYGRKPLVWWNYPVNDYLPGKLALGPVVGLAEEAAPHMAGFFMNPMEQERLSQLALATGAAYAENPAGYQAEKAWQKALVSQYGPLAGSMQVLACHSQRMENSWAHTGRPDAEALQKTMGLFWSQVNSGQNFMESGAVLQQNFKGMQEAAVKLKQNLPPEVLREGGLQVQLLGQLGRAGTTAVKMVQEVKQGQVFSASRSYRSLLEQQAAFPALKEARLSERTGLMFVEEAKSWYERHHRLSNSK